MQFCSKLSFRAPSILFLQPCPREALSSCTWLNLSCCQDLVSVGNRVEEAGCSLELAHHVCSDSTGENLITYTVSVAILEATKCNTAGQATVLLI